LSTWGDPYYVGLTGLDLFDEKGFPISVDGKRQATANPPDINILEGYEDDPRTIDKVFDGVNRTRDDYHAWLAPFTEGAKHTITVTFDQPTTITMIRCWNFNKSRIHSYRGVRYVEIYFDKTMIFCGEIRRAPGELKGIDAAAEYILFTDSEAVLSAIEANDPIPVVVADAPIGSLPGERPDTTGLEGDEPTPRDKAIVMGTGQRPKTTASRLNDDENNLDLPIQDCPVVSQISFHLLTTWGDSYYCGLTELDLFDENCKKIPLRMSMLFASPKDINDLPDSSGADDRTLDKYAL
jgi:hypothetical protein